MQQRLARPDGAKARSFDIPAFQHALLRWYDASRRDLPWRARPGEAADPYRVWLSEIMLQQTTVKAVIPYYRAFLDRWPDVEALAAASLDEVLAAWAGLGYYSRARNLHACALEVARLGAFPKDEAALKALPGIGAYTAGAIAAIAFGRQAAAVDGNVERVAARLFAVEEALPQAKPRLAALAQELVPRDRPGDHAQAMMDLGATICSPKSPSCLVCPVSGFCAGLGEGIAASLPRKSVKARRPLRQGAAFVAIRQGPDGCFILLRKRPAKGLLGGMMEVPGTIWAEMPGTEMAAEADGETAPFPADWRRVPGLVRHVFTHFQLELTVFAAFVDHRALSIPPDCRWSPLANLANEALPGVMRKAIAHGLAALALDEAPNPNREAQ
jgi:A/G-specific adenine glycosylase